jgi:hypothetical protein
MVAGDEQAPQKIAEPAPLKRLIPPGDTFTAAGRPAFLHSYHPKASERSRPRIPIQSVPIVATSAKLKPWLNALVATAAEHSNESRRSAASSEKNGRPVRLNRATVFPEF